MEPMWWEGQAVSSPVMGEPGWGWGGILGTLYPWLFLEPVCPVNRILQTFHTSGFGAYCSA